MYARVIKFCLGPNSRWEADHMADVKAALLEKQIGFRGAYFLNDYENGECEWTSFWATMESWNQSFTDVTTRFRSMMPDNIQWEPVVQIFEVHQPKPLRL